MVRGEATLFQPIGIIVVPYQAMAPDLHLVGPRKANHRVALSEMVSVWVWTQSLPLHRVFRL